LQRIPLRKKVAVQGAFAGQMVGGQQT